MSVRKTFRWQFQATITVYALNEDDAKDFAHQASGQLGNVEISVNLDDPELEEFEEDEPDSDD